MISNIVVATDGSRTSMKAVEYAVKLARQFRAKIELLSVIDRTIVIPQNMPAVASPTHLIEPIEDYLRQAAGEHLKKAGKICDTSGVKYKSVIRSGHPVEEIIKEAKSSKADLIVMGSHGRSALKAALLGSVTYGVIHKDTSIPILIIKR